MLLEKSNTSEINQELILNENLQAPINKGDVIGNINYYLDNNLIDSVNLIANSDISKKTFWNTFNYIATDWLRMFK